MNSNTVIAQHLFQEDLYNLPPRVIVVLSKPWDEVSENDRTVLSKMLVAVRLNLSVVQIIHRTDLSIERPGSPRSFQSSHLRNQPEAKRQTI